MIYVFYNRRTLKITPVMKFLVLRNRHRLNSVGLDLQLLYSTTANGKKPRVVIVGTGWGGSRLARDIDVNLVLLKVLSDCLIKVQAKLDYLYLFYNLHIP
jgi:hypothetical protein